MFLGGLAFGAFVATILSGNDLYAVQFSIYVTGAVLCFKKRTASRDAKEE